MIIYYDHAVKQLDMLESLNKLQSTQDMKLYKLLNVTWNKLTIVLLQRIHHVYMIVETLMYNRIYVDKMTNKA